MTDHEFDERFRGKYRAAASSWTPDAKTKNALLEKLQPAPAPRRTAARVLRPAAAVCCCLVIGAAAVFALRSQPQTDGIALTAVTEDESAAAAMFAAPAEGDAAPAADGAGSAEKAQARDAQNGAVAFAEAADAAGSAWLTQEEIDALREQYPIADPADSPAQLMSVPPVEQVRGIADTFVCGEVIAQEDNVEGYAVYAVHTLRVTEDTAGLFEAGDEISLCMNTAIYEYSPQLAAGMRLVIPVTVSGEPEGYYNYTSIGMYYVTPEGYVLSAFDEAKYGDGVWSGAPLGELLENLAG